MEERSNKLKTKILCTIGPATWERDVLDKIIHNGMTVARINASFADEAEIKRVTSLIREINQDVSVLLDLKGHKIRVSDFGEPIEVEQGQELILSTDPNYSGISISYENLHNDINVGDRILIDDGKVQLLVKEIRGQEIICECQNKGVIMRLKTVNVPGVKLSFDPLTEKDKVDIQAGIEAGVDFIAGSFVRDVNDIYAIKERIATTDIEVIAKIEDPLGVRNFDSILQEVYGIMIARGDLGVEIPYEEVPPLQKQFIEKCNLVAKPVIVATHMLESMTKSPTPTRAEVSDVANAIYDGTDAIMLSAETSTGSYPIEAVDVMNKVSHKIQPMLKTRVYEDDIAQVLELNKRDVNDNFAISAISITKGLYEISKNIDLKAVLVLTKTGFTARLISRLVLPYETYAFVPTRNVARKLNLTGRINPFIIENLGESRDLTMSEIVEYSKNKGIIAEGDFVAIVIGSRIFSGKSASIIELKKVN
jgi:pyruvate kinase